MLFFLPINEKNYKRKYLTLVTRQNNATHNLSLKLFRSPRSKSHTFHSEACHDSG